MNYTYSFEISPGKRVYIPTRKASEASRKIVCKIGQRWQPHPMFFHLKGRHGHLGALRRHRCSTLFATCDIQSFFGSVTRTKVDRALKRIGFTHKQAFSIAHDSCVEENNRHILPYGFPQSMLLATLVLEQSALGRALGSANDFGVRLSVYVDDILISSNDPKSVNSFLKHIDLAADTAGFSFNQRKCQPPSEAATSFNCKIDSKNIVITDERMEKFRCQLIGATEACQEGIEDYIAAVNPTQLLDL